MTRKNRQAPTFYRIERLAGLTHTRLKSCLKALQQKGFIEDPLRITDLGYAFLEDVSSKVLPVLRKYGFQRDGR